MLITEYIRDQLLFNERVTLPGFGTFELARESAKISGNRILPPGTTVIFSETGNDDTKLASAIASGEDISVEEAAGRINEFASGIRTVIDRGEKFELTGIGTLYRDLNNTIQFDKDPLFIVDFDSFGLESFELEPGITEDRVEFIPDDLINENADVEFSPGETETEFIPDSFIAESFEERQPWPEEVDEISDQADDGNMPEITEGSEFITWADQDAVSAESARSEFLNEGQSGEMEVPVEVQDETKLPQTGVIHSEFAEWNSESGDPGVIASEFVIDDSMLMSKPEAVKLQETPVEEHAGNNAGPVQPSENVAQSSASGQNEVVAGNVTVQETKQEINSGTPTGKIYRVHESDHRKNKYIPPVITAEKKRSRSFIPLAGIAVAVIALFIILQFTPVLDGTPLKIINNDEKPVTGDPQSGRVYETIEYVDPLAGREYKEYHIIAGSFSDTLGARQYAMELTKEGYRTIILNQGEGIYRVSVFSYNSKQEGIDRLRQFRAETRNNAAWLLGIE